MKHKVVDYKGQRYSILDDKCILDHDVYLELQSESIKFIQCGYYYITTMNKYLHAYIMPESRIGNYVDHINRNVYDNRRANLRYATQSEQNKNQSKKRRNANLPDCGININNIPTFIWYVKENGNHGSRWCVEIKNKYKWRTTSSKKLSIKCKFELAKKHLRQLLQNRPDLFIGHCMNGELCEQGVELEKEYCDLLGQDYTPFTKDYLKRDLNGLTDNEKELVYT